MEKYTPFFRNLYSNIGILDDEKSFSDESGYMKASPLSSKKSSAYLNNVFAFFKSFTALAILFVLFILAIKVNAQTVLPITTSGSWVVPANVNSVTVYTFGGGGGSGGGNGACTISGNGGGGGGGGMASSVLSVSPGQTYTVTIGAGGTGGAAGITNGTAGGNTTFSGPGGTVSAYGGGYGTNVSGCTGNNAGGAGGGGSGTTVYTGGAGSYGINGSTYTPTGSGGGCAGSGGGGGTVTGCAGVGGAGGGGTYPGGSGGYNSYCNSSNSTLAGVAGNFPGGGGSGPAAYGSVAGGNGAAGEVILVYNACPAVTMTVPADATSAGVSAIVPDGFITTGKRNCWYYYLPAASGTIQWPQTPYPDYNDMGMCLASGSNMPTIPGGSGTYSGLTFSYTCTPPAGCNYFTLDLNANPLYTSTSPAIGISCNNTGAYAPYGGSTNYSLTYSSGVNTSTSLVFTGSTQHACYNTVASAIYANVGTSVTITTNTGVNWQVVGSGATAVYYIPVSGSFTVNVRAQILFSAAYASPMLTTNTEVNGDPYMNANGVFNGFTPSAGTYYGANYLFDCLHDLNNGYVNNTTYGKCNDAFNPKFYHYASPTATISASAASVCINGAAPTVTITNTSTFPETVSYTINGTAYTTATIAASGTSVLTVPVTTAGTFTYALTSATCQSPPAGVCTGSLSASTAVVVVAKPTASGGGSQTICANNSALVSGMTSSNGTISWGHNGGGSITNGTTLTPTYASVLADAGHTVTLTMTVTNSPCAVATAIYSVIVNPLPTAGAITGPATAVCMGSTLQLTANASGTSPFTYSWTSSDPSKATVSATGVVTPVAVGNTNITYTVTDSHTPACSATSAAYLVTINALPVANAITGGSSVCVGSTLQLTANALGTPTLTYTWASSVPGAATVSNTGLVSSVAAGTTNITYTVTDGHTPGCSATSAAFPVTVNLTPSATINSVSGTCFNPALAPIALSANNVSGTYSSVTWSYAGTGTFGITNPNSLTTASLTPTSANGVGTLSLFFQATGGVCGNYTATQAFSWSIKPIAPTLIQAFPH